MSTLNAPPTVRADCSLVVSTTEVAVLASPSSASSFDALSQTIPAAGISFSPDVDDSSKITSSPVTKRTTCHVDVTATVMMPTGLVVEHRPSTEAMEEKAEVLSAHGSWLQHLQCHHEHHHSVSREEEMHGLAALMQEFEEARLVLARKKHQLAVAHLESLELGSRKWIYAEEHRRVVAAAFLFEECRLTAAEASTRDELHQSEEQQRLSQLTKWQEAKQQDGIPLHHS